MTYERFSELWDALVKNSPKSDSANERDPLAKLHNGTSRETLQFYANYGRTDDDSVFDDTAARTRCAA
ncbi:MAG: hypothetical protein LBR07_07050 [Puniceicoccales bacterium]|jgi:hypothetical protein|nr:hypothetical protein [Puniceicoccales bacterium]